MARGAPPRCRRREHEDARPLDRCGRPRPRPRPFRDGRHPQLRAGARAPRDRPRLRGGACRGRRVPVRRRCRRLQPRRRRLAGGLRPAPRRADTAARTSARAGDRQRRDRAAPLRNGRRSRRRGGGRHVLRRRRAKCRRRGLPSRLLARLDRCLRARRPRHSRRSGGTCSASRHRRRCFLARSSSGDARARKTCSTCSPASTTACRPWRSARASPPRCSTRRRPGTSSPARSSGEWAAWPATTRGSRPSASGSSAGRSRSSCSAAFSGTPPRSCGPRSTTACPSRCRSIPTSSRWSAHPARR